MSNPLSTAPEGVTTIILTKNCAASLSECLSSLKEFVRPHLGDEVIILDTGSTDNTLRVARSPYFTSPAVTESTACRILERPDLSLPGMHALVRQYLPEQAERLTLDPQFKDGFLGDFAEARQIATDAAKNDLIFWIDSDDVLLGAEALREAIAKHFRKPEEDNLFLAYDYSFDEDGQCTTVLWRERVVRRSAFHWKGCCHESLLRRDGQPSMCFKFDGAKLIHKHGRAHEFSDLRNYAILRRARDAAIERKEWLDPRWEYYLGNACRGLSRWQEAIEWYSKTLRRSGARDDRLSCALNIANVFLLYARPWRAIDWFFQATKIHPAEPRAYFGIARAYFELKRWRDCILYTELGRAIIPPEHITSVDPHSFDFYPGVFECSAYKELGLVDEATRRARALFEQRPLFAPARDLHEDMQRWGQIQQIKALVSSVSALAFSEAGALDIVRSIKPEIRKHIPELQIETYCSPPQKSITYLCGVTHETWDPTSVKDGVGGSEKMVILLAERFARAGWRVDVYGNPKPENRYKNFDGVTYKPAESFNPSLERDVVIVWRNHAWLDAPLKARKIFVDLHDVQDPAYYTPERTAKVSGYFFKSRFHASPVSKALNGQAIVSRNGIVPEQFATPAARRYKRVLFTSSGDRGLKRALRIFSRVKAIHPDAELRLFYGFTPLYLKNAAAVEYQHFGDEQDARHMLDYLEECNDLGAQCGAVFKGRVGHEELARELAEASCVLYPTTFPEISCMSMMEAQAAGCIPVCSTAGALQETVQNGLLFTPESSDDEYVAALDGIFRKGSDLDSQREEMRQAALESFSIDTLSADWLERFSP